MSFQVDIIGGDKIAARLNGMASNVKRPKNVYRQAHKTLTKTIRRTPMKTGALRRSGKVEVVGSVVEISFGGAEAPYAGYVHEIMSYIHPVGQAKYLESAVQEDSRLFADALAKDMMGK